MKANGPPLPSGPGAGPRPHRGRRGDLAAEPVAARSGGAVGRTAGRRGSGIGRRRPPAAGDHQQRDDGDGDRDESTRPCRRRPGAAGLAGCRPVLGQHRCAEVVWCACGAPICPWMSPRTVGAGAAVGTAAPDTRRRTTVDENSRNRTVQGQFRPAAIAAGEWPILQVDRVDGVLITSASGAGERPRFGLIAPSG